MIRVYIADSLLVERTALRLMLLDLKMKVVGEASNWLTTTKLSPLSKLNMLLVDWSLLPRDANAALARLRLACPNPIVIVLIGQMDARQQAALSSGADVFISKSETSDRVVERLQAAAASLL